MEQGLSSDRRVLAVCTKKYVEKANSGHGGVGYEKMILSSQLMESMDSNKVIPVVRDGDGSRLVPTFLASRVYIDFRDDSDYEQKYTQLVYEIHGQKVCPRPPLGPNPFFISIPSGGVLPLAKPERYVAPGMCGVVSFDYSSNNGRFVFGAGDMIFETAWSRGNTRCIHALSDPASIHSLAIAVGEREISGIDDAAKFDFSSRVRTPFVGEILVWINVHGYCLATKVLEVQVRNESGVYDNVKIEYKIASMKSMSFVSS